MARTKLQNEERPAVALVEIPMAAVADELYRPRHVQVQLDRRQSLTLKRAMAGLDAAGARLASGRRVGSACDVIRWVLDQAAG
jgi:hypothetical protein